MVYRFGEHELDLERHELRRRGARITLEPRVFDVLAYLLGQRARVVSKDELLARVWPGREVSDAALTRAIHAARRALGGARDGWIRTVYGRGFVFVGAAEARNGATRSVAPAAACRAVPSVAVLPFADLSAARDQAYFCDGLVQELIDALGRVKGLAVASRTSSYLLAAASSDVRAIGERLNVSAVLEGSVRKEGGRLRLSVQLVDTADNYRLWSATFDRCVADVFTVQEEVAASVARTLHGVVTQEARRALGTTPRTTEAAYDCYLRARQLCGRPSQARLEAARQLYRRAIELDATYAPGHAGLADCATFLYLYWGAPARDLAMADEVSRHAIALGPELAECHAARASLLATTGHLAEADDSFRTAIRLKPRLAKTHYLHGRFCLGWGRLGDAGRALERAVALSPDEAQLTFLLGKAYERLGRPRDARAAYARTVAAAERQSALEPEDERLLYIGAGALVALGEHRRGCEWAERAIALVPDDAVVLVFGAAAYAGAGRIGEALDLVERGVAAGFRGTSWLRVEPLFDGLRAEPRFAALAGTRATSTRGRRAVAAHRPRASA